MIAPIMFVIVPDPVGSGLVDSLSRPGGNATGISEFEFGVIGKRMYVVLVFARISWSIHWDKITIDMEQREGKI
jgi:hypothetical protein